MSELGRLRSKLLPDITLVQGLKISVGRIPVKPRRKVNVFKLFSENHVTKMFYRFIVNAVVRKIPVENH